MQIYRHFETLPAHARGAVIAVGNFDGLHKGHQVVIDEAGLIARDLGVPWAVLTFEPHPSSVFMPGCEPFRLTPFRIKARLLEEHGVDAMIVQRFNREFSQCPPEKFVRDVLVDGFGARHIVSGYDFAFGHKRAGNCELLLSLGRKYEFGFTAVSPVHANEGDIESSTRVRNCLKQGDPKGAAAILDRPHQIENRVASGDKRGRTIGFPTANLHFGGAIRPALGVYAVRAGLHGPDGITWHNGVANIGQRPTFNGSGTVLETHIFDFNEDIYGQLLSVALIDYIRPEKKFDGLDSLKTQIKLDCVTARQILDTDFPGNSRELQE